MSRSHHSKSARKRRREELLERTDEGAMPLDLLKLQELSLKKLGAKDTERAKRAATKVGALRFHKSVFRSGRWDFSAQKTRGLVSDVNGVAPHPPKKPNQAPEPTPPLVTIRADARLAPSGVVAHL